MICNSSFFAALRQDTSRFPRSRVDRELILSDARTERPRC